MLEEHLDKFSTDETCITLDLNLGMSMENPVVQQVGASAARLDDGGKGCTAASLRGYLNDIQNLHPDDIFSCMDEVAAGLEDLGSAVYDLAMEAFSSHIFAVETVEAYGDERGTGLALMLLAATLENLSSGRIITAVLYACPFYPEKLTAAELKAGRKKLRDHWAKLGFRRVSPRSNYMVLVAENYETPAALLTS